MLALQLGHGARPLRVLALGAHADDIEIGCGGLLLWLLQQDRPVEVHWCVLSASAERAAEASASAARFLEGAADARVTIATFEDGHFPYQGAAIKRWFEALKTLPLPDLVLTHARHDRHQDHSTLAELSWNTFRDQLILEYEILKYDGDLATPNLYLPLPEPILERKLALLALGFPSQRGKHWFDPESFRGLARLRGIECAAPCRYAEGFFGHKLVLG